MNKNQFKFEHNKILLHNNPFAFLAELEDVKDFICLTPSTKIKSFFDWNVGGLLLKYLAEHNPHAFDQLVNMDKAKEIENLFNSKAEYEFINYEHNATKLSKNFFIIDQNQKINVALLQMYLFLLEQYTTSNMFIFLFGFDNAYNHFLQTLYKNITIVKVVAQIQNIGLSWNNLEMLTWLENDEVQETWDKGKLKAFLELKTKTVLTYKDIDDFLNDEDTFNCYLIAKVFRQL